MGSTGKQSLNGEWIVHNAKITMYNTAKQYNTADGSWTRVYRAATKCMGQTNKWIDHSLALYQHTIGRVA